MDRQLGTITSILQQITLLSLIALGGTIIAELLPIAVPQSITGMLLCLVLLATRVIRLEHLAAIAHLLLAYMGLLFIPPVVSLVEHLSLLDNHLIPFIMVSILSTMLTFMAALFSAKLTIAIQHRIRRKS